MAKLELTKKYKPYDSYTDSSLEWVGDIPSSWETQRTMALFNFSNEKGFEDDYDALSVTYGGIKKQIENAAKVAEGSTRKLVHKGDIVINGRSDRRGAVGMSDYDGVVSLVYNVLQARSGSGAFPRYYHYLFRSKIFSDEFYRWGRGIVDDLWTTRSNEMKRIMLPKPPFEEQKKIASFLDEKTAAIDAVIEKRQRQIELLKERRFAAIRHTVTKGVVNNREFVDSKIDWIGDVPSEWKIMKLKSGFSFKKGKNAGKYTQEYVNDVNNKGEYPVYSGQTANDGVLGTINEYVYDFPDGVLFSTTVGAKAMTTKLLYGRFCLSQNCVLMIPNNLVEPRYFNYMLEIAFSRMKDEIPSHMQPSLRVSDLNKFTVPFPDVAEQKKIADYLDNEYATFNELVKAVGKSIDLLTELKSTLISHAVTGKIKI